MVDSCERDFGRPATVEPMTDHIKSKGTIHFNSRPDSERVVRDDPFVDPKYEGSIWPGFVRDPIVRTKDGF